AGDALVDAGRRIDAAVEDDREVAGDVLLGDVAEALRARRAEGDRDLPVAGRVRIRLHARVGELVARQQRAFLDDPGHAPLFLALAIEAALIEHLRRLGHAARERLLGRRPLVDELELEQARLPDQRLRAIRI